MWKEKRKECIVRKINVLFDLPYSCTQACIEHVEVWIFVLLNAILKVFQLCITTASDPNQVSGRDHSSLPTIWIFLYSEREWRPFCLATNKPQPGLEPTGYWLSDRRLPTDVCMLIVRCLDGFLSCLKQRFATSLPTLWNYTISDWFDKSNNTIYILSLFLRWLREKKRNCNYWT